VTIAQHDGQDIVSVGKDGGDDFDLFPDCSLDREPTAVKVGADGVDDDAPRGCGRWSLVGGRSSLVLRRGTVIARRPLAGG
jgi:hypothetical protein